MNLQNYREEIDKIDHALIECFVRRMRVSEQLAVYKRENALPVCDEKREAEKLALVENALPEDLRSSGASLYRLLFALSRERQEQVLAQLDTGDTGEVVK